MATKWSLSLLSIRLFLVMTMSTSLIQASDVDKDCIERISSSNVTHFYPEWGKPLTQQNFSTVKSESDFNFKEKKEDYIVGFVGSTFSVNNNLQRNKEGQSLDGFYGELRDGPDGPIVTAVMADGFGGHHDDKVEDEAISKLVQNTCETLCKKIPDLSRIESPLETNWSILVETAEFVKKIPGYMESQAQAVVSAFSMRPNPEEKTYDGSFMNYGDTYGAYIKLMEDSIKWITICPGRKKVGGLNGATGQFPRELINKDYDEKYRQIFYDFQVITEIIPKKSFVILGTDGLSDLLPKIEKYKNVDEIYLTSIFNDEEISNGIEKYLQNNFEQLSANDLLTAVKNYIVERHQTLFNTLTSRSRIMGDDIACVIAKLPNFDEIEKIKHKDTSSSCIIS